MATTTDDTSRCAEFAAAGASRRAVLQSALGLGAATATAQLVGDAFVQASHAGVRGGSTLVVLSLRGGIDGLGVVVPHAEADYYRVRPGTAVPAGSLLCRDATFGLHPSMKPLERFWASGELAAVQAVGLRTPNRSHFSAVEEVEDAAPGSEVRSGWINRMIGMSNAPKPLDAVQVGSNFPPSSMLGPHAAVATPALHNLALPGLAGNASNRYASLEAAWRGSRSPIASGARGAVRVSRDLAQPLSGAGSVAYPTDWFARPFVEPLKNAAQLVKADLGTDVITIDAGAWDYHAGYGGLNGGTMQTSVSGLAKSLAAFLDDIGSHRSRVTVLTISEFGRRIGENGSGGFDHGWGNMMLLAGAGVRGGRYHARWPGLRATDSDSDLAVTTDYRDVLAEVIAKRFPERSVATLFPGLVRNPLGVMA